MKNIDVLELRYWCGQLLRLRCAILFLSILAWGAKICLPILFYYRFVSSLSGGASGVNGVEGTGVVKQRSSWYRSQFKELENLGKGGFGTVVKVHSTNHFY